MVTDAAQPFGAASRWSRRSEIAGDELIVASPHTIEDGTNLDVWVHYRRRNYVATAYSVADVARLVERDFVQYDRSWFVVETITEDNLVRAVKEIITSGGLDSVFEPISEM